VRCGAGVSTDERFDIDAIELSKLSTGGVDRRRNTAMSQEWRGYVNTLIYGLNLERPPSDTVVTELVDELIAQRVFNGPLEEFYCAAIAALDSTEDLATFDYTNDAAVRDLLERAIALLDERRPWPEPPFYSFHPPKWPELLGEAPLIGRIALSRRHLEERLNRPFARVAIPFVSNHGTAHKLSGGAADSEPSPGTRKVDILILRLRGGYIVGLKMDPANPRQGIDVHAASNPTTGISALRELAGLDVESITSTDHG
jgi:hypothetical protein